MNQQEIEEKQQRKEKMLETKKYKDTVEKLAILRRAQNELRNNELDEIQMKTKNQIIIAIQEHLSREEQLSQQSLKRRYTNWGIGASFIGLSAVALLPQPFRKFRQMRTIYKQ